MAQQPKQTAAIELSAHELNGRTPSQVQSSNDANRSSAIRASSASSIPNIQRSISETIGETKSGEDSPVMNETLSVIDEHITDLSTPRHSVIRTEALAPNDSASEYSSHVDGRLSFLDNAETDDEDARLRESEVKKWDHVQVAQHLRQLGVDDKHCNIFQEQEITGEVLLEMNQDFLFMKEYDFGVMGRRLKTWHKIRALQEEVKGPHAPQARKSFSNHSSHGDSIDGSDKGPTRPGGGTILPRIPSIHQQPGVGYRQPRSNTITQSDLATLEKVSPGTASNYPPSASTASSRLTPATPLSAWQSSGQPDSPSRPSAASIRELHHSRRHSSIDVTSSPSLDSNKQSAISPRPMSNIHKKQGSLDRNWSMTSAAASMIPPSLSGIYQSSFGSIRHGRGPSGSQLNTDTHPSPNMGVPDDLDRGYFSGNDIESRKTRNVLRKRDSAASASHSRQSSVMDDQKRSLTAAKRQSRIGSADSIRDIVPQVTSPASKAYHSNSFRGRFRTGSMRSATAPTKGGISPTVTNLEDMSNSAYQGSPKLDSDTSGPSSPLHSLTTKSNSTRRGIGLRAISDAVTGNEKAFVNSPTSLPSPIKENIHSPTRTNSTTPSQASKSIDNDNTDTSSKNTDGNTPLTASSAPSRARTKTKRETSAYIRGLEKKTPAEQIEVCDHSGWMKKKSKGVIATWKPRLFVLRGRRLSYYYSEDDIEEKGVIDVSHHRVLRADTDPLTTFHATITGSTSSPTSASSDKASTVNGESNSQPSSAKFQTKHSEPPFFFKLVPPKAGLPRAVQFTKPATHYFQVDNIAEGRKWMGELMKATIERDVGMGFETTNKQKTISLAAARARKERPPNLMADNPTEMVIEGPKSDETGLNIRGLSFDNLSEQGKVNGSTHKKMNSLDIFTSLDERPKSAILSENKENTATET